MGCRKQRDARSFRCQEAIDLSRFDPYEFQFATHFSLVERLEGKEGKVCFEGASHSRILFNRASNLLSTAPFNATIKNVEIVGTYHSQYTKFVHQFTHEKIQAIIAKNCTKVIVGTGQWDAYRPTLFPAYEKALETAMSMMGDMFRNANVDLFFRTTQWVALCFVSQHLQYTLHMPFALVAACHQAHAFVKVLLLYYCFILSFSYHVFISSSIFFFKH